MDLQSQLIPKLKALRLSGILQTLEVRNRQAIENLPLFVTMDCRGENVYGAVEEESRKRLHI